MPTESLYFRLAAVVCVLVAMFGRLMMDVWYPPIYTFKFFTHRREWSIRFFAYIFGFFPVMAQLVGWEILPMSVSRTSELIIRSTGVVLMVIAVIGTLWPRYVRLQAWSSPMISPDRISNHTLVTHGPYRFIRHPYYSSIIIGVLGLEMALASYWLFFTVPLLIGCAVYGIAHEEQQLREVYKEEFTSYAARSWRLMPFVY